MSRRRSRREIRQAIERLERDSDSDGDTVEYDGRELTAEEKDALSDTFDVDPYADAEGPSLEELEDLVGDLM